MKQLDINMKNNQCYLCGNKEMKLIVPLDWPIKKCLKCHLIQVNPLPSIKEVNNLYQGDYWKKLSFFSSQIQAHEKYFQKKITDIKKLRKSGRLLDVGCAFGSLIKEANDRGFISEGIDISSYAVKQCQKLNLKATTGVITDVNKKIYYDVITAFEVIEHERDPLLTIKTAYQLLKPNGLLIVSVPGSDTLSSIIMGKFWFGYKNKEHLFHFIESSLNKLLRKGGFSNIIIKKDIARSYLFTYYLERINYYLFKSKRFNKFLLLLKKVPIINKLTVPLSPWGNIIAYAVKKNN